MTTVMNLATGDKLTFSCSPKEAVIAAYAQSKSDHSTWDYSKYADKVQTGKLCYLLGDYSAFIDGRQF